MIRFEARRKLASTCGLILLFAAARSASAETFDLEKPITLHVTKFEYNNSFKQIDSALLNVSTLGSHKVDFKIAIDTGSSGMTIPCRTVLPANLCQPDGIKIDHETTVDGIRITTEQGIAIFGSEKRYGNIAYAPITLGDADASVTIAKSVPFLLEYKVVTNRPKDVSEPGILGIANSPGDLEGRINSPLLGMTVGPGLHRGYILGDLGAGWKRCDLRGGNCPQVSALQIGIDPNANSDFITKEFEQKTDNGPLPIGQGCVKMPSASVCGWTVFDSGTSDIWICDPTLPKNKTFLPAGSDVEITGPLIGTWAFKSLPYQIRMCSEKQLLALTVGIQFFEKHKLLVDLDSQLQGIAP